MVPIALGNFQFNVIDTNSIDLGLIYQTVDSMYYDVPGRSRTPFNVVNSFVAAAIADSVEAGQVLFSFNNALVFNYSNKTIASLNVDFGNGTGSQSVTIGQNKLIYYNSAGDITLKFVVNFTDNSTVTTYAALRV